MAAALVGGGTAARGGNNSNNNGNGATPPPSNPAYIPDEIVTSFAAGTLPQAIADVSRRNNLTAIETQSLPLIGTSLYRWRIGGGRSVASVVQALGSENTVASVQPNYLFALQEELRTCSRHTRGGAIRVELRGPICSRGIAGRGSSSSGDRQGRRGRGNRFGNRCDASGFGRHNSEKLRCFDGRPQSSARYFHAGAIAAHGKLLGIAPGVEIVAAHAFDGGTGHATGTSFAIDKGVQWAADNHARIINMSFAGPADPMLERLLAAAFNKGIVLIAAAGNAGPQSEPLYPAADPDVIAVTATDEHYHMFDMANRGRYIAVAAPGVDILALAPGGAYQVTTGTSIAAAHVSGIAALLLERKPSLTPSDIRSVLVATAKQIGPPVPDSGFGAGLVNAFRAVTWLDRKPAEFNGDGTQAKQ